MGALQENATAPMTSQSSAFGLLEHETDNMLIDKVVAGNRQALAAVYDRYSPLVYALALHVTRDSDSAEDTLHEVFMELWRIPGTFNSATGTLAGWLSSRARQVAVSSLHANNQRRVSPSSAEDNRSAECIPYLEKIRSRLDDLPSDQREVFDLAYFGRFFPTNIAQNTNRPLAQVNGDICLALNSLRRPISAGVKIDRITPRGRRDAAE